MHHCVKGILKTDHTLSQPSYIPQRQRQPAHLFLIWISGTYTGIYAPQTVLWNMTPLSTLKPSVLLSLPGQDISHPSIFKWLMKGLSTCCSLVCTPLLIPGVAQFTWCIRSKLPETGISYIEPCHFSRLLPQTPHPGLLFLTTRHHSLLQAGLDTCKPLADPSETQWCP